MADSWLHRLGLRAPRGGLQSQETNPALESGQSLVAGAAPDVATSALDAGPEGFWEFSLEVYARLGVAPACLRLQDRDRLDVNLVLFALWAGAARGVLSPVSLSRAIELSERWRDEVVGPLRTARRALKAPDVPVEVSGASTLRSRVKSAELAAEKLQQFMLAPLAEDGDPPPGRAAAEANLAAYLGAAGLTVGAAKAAETAADAVTVLEAVFGPEG